MSDFSNEFATLYVAIITIVSMMTCAILLYNRSLSTIPADPDKDER